MEQTINRSLIAICLLVLGIAISVISYSQYRKNGLAALVDEQGMTNYLAVPSLQFSEDWHHSFNLEEDLEAQFKVTPNYAYSAVVFPFYLIADALEQSFGITKFGIPRSHFLALYLCNLLFGLLAVFFTFQFILRFYKPSIGVLTVLIIVFATNAYIYLTQLIGYPDLFLWMLVSAFCYHIAINESYTNIKLIGLSVLFGVLIGIAPAYFALALIPFFSAVRQGYNMQQCGAWLLRMWKETLLPVGLIFTVFQLSTVGIEQQEATYFFLSPRLYEALLEYRKGWFIYTPIMIFAIIGLIRAIQQRRFANYFSWEIFISLFIFMYISFSWWNWWYSDSFGQRIMIPFYAILALGIAEWLKWVQHNRSRTVQFWAVAFGGFFILLNIFQSNQYKEGIWSKDGMTERLYWASFGAEEAVSIFRCIEAKPNYKIAFEEGRLEVSKVCDEEFRLYLKWLSGKLPDGTPKEAYGVVRFQQNQTGVIYYDRVQKWRSMIVSLDSDDDYEVRFYKNNRLVDTDYLASNGWFTEGLWNHAYVLDEATQNGFDKIEIEPKAGDSAFAIGHIEFY